MRYGNENLRLTENAYRLYLLLSLLMLLALTACADHVAPAVPIDNPPTPAPSITHTPTPLDCLIRAHIVSENSTAAWSSPNATEELQASSQLESIVALLRLLNEKSKYANTANSIILHTDACSPEELSSIQAILDSAGNFENLSLEQTVDEQGNMASVQLTLTLPDGSTLIAQLPLNQMWTEIGPGFVPNIRHAQPTEMATIWNKINAVQTQPIAVIATTSDAFSSVLVNSGQLLAPIIMETLKYAPANQVLVVEVTANYGVDTQKYLAGARITEDGSTWMVHNSTTSIDTFTNQVTETSHFNYVDTTVVGAQVTITVYMVNDTP